MYVPMTAQQKALNSARLMQMANEAISGGGGAAVAGAESVGPAGQAARQAGIATNKNTTARMAANTRAGAAMQAPPPPPYNAIPGQFMGFNTETAPAVMPGATAPAMMRPAPAGFGQAPFGRVPGAPPAGPPLMPGSTMAPAGGSPSDNAVLNPLLRQLSQNQGSPPMPGADYPKGSSPAQMMGPGAEDRTVLFDPRAARDAHQRRLDLEQMRQDRLIAWTLNDPSGVQRATQNQIRHRESPTRGELRRDDTALAGTLNQTPEEMLFGLDEAGTPEGRRGIMANAFGRKDAERKAQEAKESDARRQARELAVEELKGTNRLAVETEKGLNRMLLASGKPVKSDPASIKADRIAVAQAVAEGGDLSAILADISTPEGAADLLKQIVARTKEGVSPEVRDAQSRARNLTNQALGLSRRLTILANANGGRPPYEGMPGYEEYQTILDLHAEATAAAMEELQAAVDLTAKVEKDEVPVNLPETEDIVEQRYRNGEFGRVGSEDAIQKAEAELLRLTGK